jgi:hypothetical protein
MINKNILINALKRYDSVMEACSKTGITRSTYYRWRENRDFRRVTNLIINMKSKQRPHFGMDVTTVKPNICPHCGQPIGQTMDNKLKKIGLLKNDMSEMKRLYRYTDQVRKMMECNNRYFGLLIACEGLIRMYFNDKNRILKGMGVKPMILR